MLTRASLTIRLHPNDDVVIARTQLVSGTRLAGENGSSVCVLFQAASRAHLREHLSVAAGGVVFTTLHKFFPEEKGDRHPKL